MATQEYVTRLPAFQETFLKDIFASAKAMQGVPMPYSPQQVASLGQGQMDAMALANRGIGSYTPFLQAATQMAGPGGAQQFLDPYLDEVVDRASSDIARQGRIQSTQNQAAAVGQGAFGGSRAALMDAELQRNVLENQARTSAALRSEGYKQAQTAALQAAGQMAGLGQMSQMAGVQDINTLLGIGQLQRGYNQQMMDVARANELAQQALPYQQIGFMSDIFRGVPALQQTYSASTQDKPSTSSQLLGLGIAGLGAYGNAMQGTGKFLNMGGN